MKIIPLENKTALRHLKKGRLPFSWDLNLYRGCGHGCKYCFAMYSHDYLEGSGDYFDTIYYKKNILETLEQELSSPKWKHEIVNIGGITDSYQPIERKLKLMPEVLKLMIKYQTPIIISTKSNLILRDLDLIEELAKTVIVNIAFTITTMDETVRGKIEPGASSSFERMKALKMLRKTNACLGIHMMPIIPYLTSRKSNIETIYRLASKIGVDYVLPGSLYLRGKTKPYFLNFLKREYEGYYQAIYQLYPKGGVDKNYSKKLYEIIHECEKKYGVTRNYEKAMEMRKRD